MTVVPEKEIEVERTEPEKKSQGFLFGTITFRQQTFVAVAALGTLLIVCLIAFVFSLQLELSKNRLQLSHANTALLAAKNSSSDSASTEISQLVDQVGTLMQLPTGEQPAIATVTDLSQLQNQPFFANAQVGDKVLIYQAAKEAILYRPSTNKIIEVAPVTDDAAQDTTKK